MTNKNISQFYHFSFNGASKFGILQNVSKHSLPTFKTFSNEETKNMMNLLDEICGGKSPVQYIMKQELYDYLFMPKLTAW